MGRRIPSIPYLRRSVTLMGREDAVSRYAHWLLSYARVFPHLPVRDGAWITPHAPDAHVIDPPRGRVGGAPRRISASDAGGSGGGAGARRTPCSMRGTHDPSAVGGAARSALCAAAVP